METFVAIGRLWLIWGEYKLNSPFCKTEARALGTLITCLFELSHGLFRICDHRGAGIHQETSAFTPSCFFFPHPLIPCGKQDLGSPPASPCLPPLFLTSARWWRMRYWNEALGWSKWTQLCNGGGYFHFPWWFTRNSAVGMKKKGQLCSWIAGVVNTTPLGNVFSQARQACKPSGEFKLMWVSSWTYLFWCFLYIWNWKETKCVWLNWVSHVFLHSFIHTCWGETLK